MVCRFWNTKPSRPAPRDIASSAAEIIARENAAAPEDPPRESVSEAEPER